MYKITCNKSKVIVKWKVRTRLQQKVISLKSIFVFTQCCSAFCQGSLQTEALIFSEMLVTVHQSAQHYISKDCNCNQLCCEDQRPHIAYHHGKISTGSNAFQLRKPHFWVTYSSCCNAGTRAPSLTSCSSITMSSKTANRICRRT
jgi:hypothetical protein